MTDFRTIFGEFLKAADLGGVARAVTIASAVPDTIKDQNGKEKPQIKMTFVNQKKEWGCNITNANTIAEIFGTFQIEQWVGKRIVLYPTMVPFGNKMVEAIRVRSIEQEKAIRAAYQGPPRAGGVMPQQPQHVSHPPGPTHVSQHLPPHDPNYVQTTLQRPAPAAEFDDVLDQTYGPSGGHDDLADDLADDIPFSDDLGDDL